MCDEYSGVNQIVLPTRIVLLQRVQTEVGKIAWTRLSSRCSIRFWAECSTATVFSCQASARRRRRCATASEAASSAERAMTAFDSFSAQASAFQSFVSSERTSGEASVHPRSGISTPGPFFQWCGFFTFPKPVLGGTDVKFCNEMLISATYF